MLNSVVDPGVYPHCCKEISPIVSGVGLWEADLVVSQKGVFSHHPVLKTCLSTRSHGRHIMP